MLNSMELRLQTNRVWFGLTPQEILRLASGETLMEVVFFGGSRRLLYELTPSSVHPETTAVLEDGHLMVIIPQSNVADWAESSAPMLAASQMVSTDGDMLTIVVENMRQHGE